MKSFITALILSLLQMLSTASAQDKNIMIEQLQIAELVYSGFDNLALYYSDNYPPEYAAAICRQFNIADSIYTKLEKCCQANMDKELIEAFQIVRSKTQGWDVEYFISISQGTPVAKSENGRRVLSGDEAVLAVVTKVASSKFKELVDKLGQDLDRDKTRIPTSTGQRGYVHMDDQEYVFLGIDERALKDFMNALANKNKINCAELVANGRVLAVENDCKVIILERTLTKTKVGFLEGEHIGKAGWIPFEFVRN